MQQYGGMILKRAGMQELKFNLINLSSHLSGKAKFLPRDAPLVLRFVRQLDWTKVVESEIGLIHQMGLRIWVTLLAP